jgi:hypothetical protein
MIRLNANFLVLAASLSLAACNFSFGGQHFAGAGVTFVVPFQNSHASNGALGIDYESSTLVAITDGKLLVVNGKLYGTLKQGDVVDFTEPGIVKVNDIPRVSTSGSSLGTKSWTLPSSHPVTVLGLRVLHFTQGNSPCLMLRYQTDVSIADVQALGTQADEIWDKFKPDLESAHVVCGFASANEPSASAEPGKGTRGYNFVYNRSADGTWSRLQTR